MPELDIRFGDGSITEISGALQGGELIHLTSKIIVSGLEAGMVSGKPSIAMAFQLPDGRWVLAETSLALLLTAADAMRARFGDPRF